MFLASKKFKKLWAELNEALNVIKSCDVEFELNVVAPTLLISSIGAILSPNNINLINIDAQVKETNVDML
jgi:hypothetical protein